MENLPYLRTAQRLQDQTVALGDSSIPAFSAETVDTVASVAERHAEYETYDRIYDKLGLRVNSFPAGVRLPVDVVDVRPDEHDPEEAIMMYLPMANPIDTNQAFQIATVAATNPHRRVIAFGNPSGGTYNSGRLNHVQRRTVRQGIDLSPLVELPERYADTQGITRADYIGYSYGALVASISAERMYRRGRTLTTIEPVLGARSLVRLGKDFKSTESSLPDYVKSAGSPLYEQARQDAISGPSYIRGILRMSNLAIASALSRTDFGIIFRQAVFYQPEMRSLLAWGDQSELADDSLASSLVESLASEEDIAVSAMRLRGHTHALANDPYLHAAIVRQSIQSAG